MASRLPDAIVWETLLFSDPPQATNKRLKTRMG
jgi:hypothetical protein